MPEGKTPVTYPSPVCPNTMLVAGPHVLIFTSAELLLLVYQRKAFHQRIDRADNSSEISPFKAQRSRSYRRKHMAVLFIEVVRLL